MKKLIALGLVMLLCGVMFVGADDAKVMPKRIGRIYLAPSFAFANGEFNKDGEYEGYDSGEGAMKALNLGVALEYGPLDWLTAALQWAPGWNMWSDVDTSIALSDEVNANGVMDLFVGAKIQIIGEKGLIQNTMFRFAVGPGIKIPLPGPDYEEQVKNSMNGDPVTAANVDKHSLGVGARVYFDYIINEKFFINLYSEFIGYPIKGDLKKSGYMGYYLATQMDGAGVDSSKIVNYGYDLTFELEPVFSTPIGGGIIFTGGLPFNYKINPGIKYDVSYPNSVVEGMFASYFVDEDPSHLFAIKPNVSFFFTSWKLPTEFRLQYGIPVAGKNDRATHSISLIGKLYLKI
ncbi:hypothetical protein AGMMS50293_00720 [Spirochaetia bacterium]|nr:hypothetical protein AGMMS50293_00720 [Spirochaetia bacterium]